MMAMRRVAIDPSPGRANSDSEADDCTSARGVRDKHLRQRIGHLETETGGHALRKLRGDIAQPCDHALANGDRLHLRELETKGVHDVRLLDVALAVPEQRGLVVVLGELLAACRGPCAPRSCCGNDMNPIVPAW